MLKGVYGSIGRVDAHALAQAGLLLQHRGSHEHLISPCDGIRLGLRSSQPSAPVGALAPPLVFAGRITNRAELAGLLGRSGADDSEASDRQLLWDLYAKLGTRAFERINGSFAIALADVESRALILAADRWAAQPLHFARVQGGWMFASEYKALVSAVDSQVDPGVADYLEAAKYLPLHRTLMTQVHAVGPGEYARIDEAGFAVEAYAPLQLEIDPTTTEERCAAELREHILSAARRLTEGYDPVGVALSGGLDSALTLGAIRKIAPDKRIYTYTASFDRSDPALRKAAEAARYFGTLHREIILAPEDLPDLLPEMVWRMEDPVAREEMLVYHALSQRAASEVPIVFYGHMADILFAGMPRHLLIKAAGDYPFSRAAITEFYDFTQTGMQPSSMLGKLLVAAYFHGKHASPPRALRTAKTGQSKHLQLAHEEPLNAALLSSIAQPSEIGGIERLHAWAGVELASIFHDREVSRCAFRIPGKFKIRGRRRKHILRVAAAGILPDVFAERPKDLIRIGRDAALRRSVEYMADELLSPAAVRSRGIFDPKDVAELRQRAATQPSTDTDFYHLWTLILVELWCRTFADGAAQRYRFGSVPAQRDACHASEGLRRAQ